MIFRKLSGSLRRNSEMFSHGTDLSLAFLLFSKLGWLWNEVGSSLEYPDSGFSPEQDSVWHFIEEKEYLCSVYS
jgi:hypothetical protein